MWNSKTGKELYSKSGHEMGAVCSVVFSPDGSMFATSGFEVMTNVGDLAEQVLPSVPVNASASNSSIAQGMLSVKNISQQVSGGVPKQPDLPKESTTKSSQPKAAFKEKESS